MNKDVIQLAIDKKYSAFSDAIKMELHNKLTDHPVSKQYATDFDHIRQMKQKFATISDVGSTEE